MAIETLDPSFQALVNNAIYICYKYNRQRTPEITPEQWALVLANVPAMEKRYQEELKNG